MFEILIAVGIFTVLVLVAAGDQLLHGHGLLIIGTVTAALGLIVGVSVGIRYHLALYRTLEPLGILEPRWW